MDDSQKLLRTIINHQSSVKEELLKEIRKTNKKVDQLSENLDEFKVETKENFAKLTNRINLLGKQLAVLDEDAPTREEFDELVEKVNRIPKNFVMA